MTRPEDADNEARRNRTNLIGVIAVVFLVALGFWLMRWLAQYEQLSDCVAAGHRDCVPVQETEQ
ncbi:MAG TPA: hypothetical protein VHU18_04970 [Rhizomicrobium sp.]|jgi:hypothetical protein|nr:hypothetical protein [Rhizomicrobium sp.]